MKWDLTQIFKTESDYEKAFETIKKLSEDLYKYENKLNTLENIDNMYKLNDEIDLIIGKCYSYVSLHANLNLKDAKLNAKLEELSLFLNEVSQKTSFINPELLANGKDFYNDIDNYKHLKTHKFSIDKLFLAQEHILSKDKELLLSYFSNVAGKYSQGDLFTCNQVMDNVCNKVTLSNGKEVLVTQGNWSSLIEDSNNEEDRKNIFEAIYKNIEKNKNLLAKVYSNVMQANLAQAKARNYSSILESFLHGNNIPTSVYETLINTASSTTEYLKKYLELRKKYFNLSEYHTYDRFLNISSSSKKYTYEEAQKEFIDSLKDSPKEYIEKQLDAIKEGFVDVYESDGKQTGAFSSGQFDMHPYILLNYSNTLDDVFTLAHEAGHSAHTLFSNENNPIATSSYTIFVAEIASTFNEHLLLDQLLLKATTDEEKLVLLQKAIDNIVSTYYRQTLFAHYEYNVSKLVEKQVPITYEVLNKIMIELYEQYYGLDITKEGYKQYVWGYIPHLYHTPFYVYQYATSFAASLKLYENVKNNKEEGFNNLMTLLKSGGNDYPVNQVKKANVDLTDSSTFLAVSNRLKELVEKLEKILDK